MSGPNPQIWQLGGSTWRLGEQALRRFEEAWRQGGQPALDDFLTADSKLRQALLVELVHTDLEFRAEAGEAVRVETYLDRYPELAQDRRAALELVAAEYRVRLNREPGLAVSDYQQRFPHLADVLPDRLASAAEDEAEPTRMLGKSVPVPAATGHPLRVPGYTILGELGRGGMGVVYKAKQEGLKRIVALKMIRAAACAGAEDLARFRAEAEAVARLQHPNIVQVYEVGEHDGLPYLALEFVDGGALNQRLGGTPLPPRRAAELIRTLAGAIHAAHERGVIHRDLKPANILLQQESGVRGQASGVKRPDATNGNPPADSCLLTPDSCIPKITDFGLAKFVAAIDTESDTLQPGEKAAALTQTGDILGTPTYMAPEQALGRSRDVGPATDVYALGVILYELLTGGPPFRAASPLDLIELVRSEEPVPPSRLQARLPGDLETICLKCLEKEPARRYTSAAALADDLDRFLSDCPILARRTSRVEHFWRWCRRNPAVASLAAALVVAVVTGLALVVWKWQEAEENALEKETQRGVAVVHQQAAERSRDLAEKREAEVRRAAYAANMTLAYQAYDLGRIGRVRDFLAGVKPMPGREDFRGFEWHCLWELCHNDQLTLQPDATTAPPVRRLAVSLDGKVLAAAGGDGKIRLWDAASGRLTRTLAGHTKAVRGVAFSPDGKLLASGSSDRTAKLWNPATGEELANLSVPGNSEPLSLTFTHDSKLLAAGCGAPGVPSHIVIWDMDKRAVLWSSERLLSVDALAFSPDDRTLITACWDKSVRLWDVKTGKEIRTLKGHAQPVLAAALSPDGATLASGSTDGVVKLWDMASGLEKDTFTVTSSSGINALAFVADSHTLAIACGATNDLGEVLLWDLVQRHPRAVFRGHADGVSCLAVLPGGKTLASGSYDGTVKLWHLATTHNLLGPSGHYAPVRAIAYSPNGRLLASGGVDRKVRLWDLVTGDQKAMLEGHTAGVWGVAFAPDGKTLATASVDKSVKIWDIASGRATHTLQDSQAVGLSVAFSPDGSILACGTTNGAALYDASSGMLLGLLEHTGQVPQLAFSPDGKVLVTACTDRLVRFWNVADRRLQAKPARFPESIWSVGYSPDGKLLALGSNLATDQAFVRLWDVAEHQEHTVLRGHTGAVTAVSFHPDGKTLLSTSRDGTPRLWDVTSGKEVGRLSGIKGEIHHGAHSPDGKTVATAGADQRVRLWDARTGAEQVLLGRAPVWSVALSPDDRLLATSSHRAVKLWEIATGAEVASLEGHDYPVRCVAFSPSGTLLAVAEGLDPASLVESTARPGEVKLWDVASRRLKARLVGHKSGVLAVAFSPDGKLLATAGEDRTVRIWDVDTATELRTLKGHRFMVRCVAFAPDGLVLASGCGDRWSNIPSDVKLWDVATGSELATLDDKMGGHSSPVVAVAFSPGGNMLATAGLDAAIRLWDLADKGKPRLLQGHTRTVTSLAFTPDGRRLISGSLDNTVKFWDPATGQELATMRSFTGAIESLAFSLNQRLLVTGGGSAEKTGRVRLWYAR